MDHGNRVLCFALPPHPHPPTTHTHTLHPHLYCAATHPCTALLCVPAVQVVFRVALALLKLHEGELLAQDNPGELLRAARRAVAQTYDRDLLMKVCAGGCGAGGWREGL